MFSLDCDLNEHQPNGLFPMTILQDMVEKGHTHSYIKFLAVYLLNMENLYDATS